MNDINALADFIRSEFAKVNQRLDTIERKIDDMQHQINDVAESVNHLVVTVSEQKKRLDVIGGSG